MDRWDVRSSDSPVKGASDRGGQWLMLLWLYIQLVLLLINVLHSSSITQHPLSLSLTPLMADRASICLYICLSDVGPLVKNFTYRFFWFTKILILFHEYIHFVCCLMFWWSEERGFLTYMWFLDVLVYD